MNLFSVKNTEYSPLPPRDFLPRSLRMFWWLYFLISFGFGFFFPLSLSSPADKKKSPVLLCWAGIQNKLQAGGEWLGRIKHPRSLLAAPWNWRFGEFSPGKKKKQQQNPAIEATSVDALWFPCGFYFFVLKDILIWGWRWEAARAALQRVLPAISPNLSIFLASVSP